MKSIDIASVPRAKKSLGQHFLHDSQVCSKIVALLDCKDQEHILEIGPGPGAVTKVLETLPLARLLLLEKDTFWAAVRQREGQPCTQTILMDALRFDWTRLQAAMRWKIVGNLPYNVASPLIWDIVSLAQFTRAVFMVQKEVGQRIAALPGSKAYGALSVWVQNYARPSLDFCVGPGAFSPPPAVDSAVLTFTPLTDVPKYPKALAQLLHICFQQRRKQLGGILRRASIANATHTLELCGIAFTARPEELTPLQFRQLATELFCSPQ